MSVWRSRRAQAAIVAAVLLVVLASPAGAVRATKYNWTPSYGDPDVGNGSATRLVDGDPDPGGSGASLLLGLVQWFEFGVPPFIF